MDLSEDPTQVGEFTQGALGERHVNGVAPPRRQIREIADVELESDLGRLGAVPRVCHRVRRGIDGEDRRTGPGELDGSGAVTATQLEDPLAGDLAEQFLKDEVAGGHARRPYWDARPLEPMDL